MGFDGKGQAYSQAKKAVSERMKNIIESILKKRNVDGRIYLCDIYELCPGIESDQAEELRSGLERILNE